MDALFPESDLVLLWEGPLGLCAIASAIPQISVTSLCEETPSQRFLGHRWQDIAIEIELYVFEPIVHTTISRDCYRHQPL